MGNLAGDAIKDNNVAQRTLEKKGNEQTEEIRTMQ